MDKKKKITSNFTVLKVKATLFIIAAPIVFLINTDGNLLSSVLGMLFVWLIGALLWWYTLTRNKVYYDKEKFYIHNRKGREIDRVSIEKITAMMFSGFGGNSILAAYRLFYDSDTGEKKEFWIFPSLGSNIIAIREKIERVNPDLITTKVSFGGIEHLFIKNEDDLK